MKQKSGKAALYMRLSRDDELVGESNSITNQRKVLKAAATELGYSLTEEYIDDGVSGTTFDRPAFLQMERDIENGLIRAVFVKDLSRLGRDHIAVGLFTEKFLLERDVRLIAVHDGIDSDTGDNEFAAIRNVFNEMYARDASKKVKNACRIRAASGEPIGHAPYGYVKDPGNSKSWVIDPEAAEVVRRIFALTFDGKGVAQIADILAGDKVLTPKNYWIAKGIQKGGSSSVADPYNWKQSSVASILKRQEYCGDIINFKSSSRVFGSKKRRKTPESERLVFKDVHEAVVSREDFERVQKLRAGTKRYGSKGSRNVFSGLLKCPDCGANLNFHTNPKNEEITYYNCPNNNVPKRKTCESTHYVRSDYLEQVVLADIQRITAFAKADEEAFIEALVDSVGLSTRQVSEALTAQLERIQKRIAELDVLFRRVYEDSALGNLSTERMLKLTRGYEEEQSEMEEQEKRLSGELTRIAEQAGGIDAFTEMIRRHSKIKKLTPSILRQFIDHIDIHQAERSEGVWTQRIDIYYSCIGKIVLPELHRIKQKEFKVITRKGVILVLTTRPRVEAIAS